MDSRQTFVVATEDVFRTIAAPAYQLQTLSNYPAEQWRLAISAFPPPSNRPPRTFWRRQRESAIAWLIRYGVADAREEACKVFIGPVMVDAAYLE